MPRKPKHYRRIYAIGDIHGRSDLLDRMLTAIEHDLRHADDWGDDVLTVTLGDYVDRGPDSRGVLDRLSRNPFPTSYVALKGNHEELFEVFLRDPSIGPQWQLLGGLETVRSYDAALVPLMKNEDFNAVADGLRAAIPRKHRRFLSSLQLSLNLDQYFLCHAGIRPGVPFEQQNPKDLLWIREQFLKSEMDFGKVVIHGHTPVKSPEMLTNRINIDTAAFATGRLTCVVLGGDSPRVLTT